MANASVAAEGVATGKVTAPSGSRFRLRLDVLLLLAPMALLILGVFDLPLLNTAYWSVGDPKTGALTTQFYGEFAHSNVYAKVILRTLKVALEVTVVTVVLGYPLAYWTTTLRSSARLVVLGIVVMTFWVSILVRTYAWIVILGNGGLVNRTLLGLGLTTRPLEFLYNEIGILVGMTNVLLPFLVLPIYAAMVKVDTRLMQVAETLGASRLRIFWQVFFPMTRQALAASAILVFILSLGFYITPAVLGGGRFPLISNMMDLLINRFAQWEMAAVISVVLMAITLSLYALYQWLRENEGAA